MEGGYGGGGGGGGGAAAAYGGAGSDAAAPPASAGGGGGLRQTVGPNGFRNIEPRTRSQRRSQADKETLEKSRLRDRTGGFHKYTDYGKSITAQAQESCAWLPEAERFHTDVAGEERLAREAELARRERLTADRREKNALREEERWASIDRSTKEEEEKWAALRDSGEKARRNQSSVPYNPLTLAYHESDDGLRLRYADDLIRFRAAQRAHNLMEKNVSVDYDPITGSGKPSPSKPARPPPPDGLDPRHL